MTGVVLKRALSERGNDIYQTPKVAVEALLRVERLPPQLWDRAAARRHRRRAARPRSPGHRLVTSWITDVQIISPAVTS